MFGVASEGPVAVKRGEMISVFELEGQRKRKTEGDGGRKKEEERRVATHRTT